MVLAMARPATRQNSSLAQFRKRVPADILEVARGQRLLFRLPAEKPADPDIEVPATIGAEVTFSLRTRSPALVKQRHAAALEQLEKQFQAIRTGPQQLTHRQIVALSGEVYKSYIAEWQDDPLDAEGWQLMAEFTTDAALEYERMGNIRPLERYCGNAVDKVLHEKGVLTDKDSRIRLMMQAAKAVIEASRRLERHAIGDYRKDDKEERFPRWEEVGRPRPDADTKAAVRFDEVFERWRLERRPAASTITTWKGCMRSFVSHLGHDDMTRAAKADVVAWKDALITRGLSVKTIGSGHLATLNTIYRYAFENGLVPSNPVDGVRVRQKKRAGETKLPYEDAEVARILALASRESHLAKRWLPWLMALSGARVGEVAQLWGQRVLVVDGIHVMRIAPAEDGGSLKNEGSERDVPIHPAIIKQGFLDFVRTRGSGPLFYGRPSNGKQARKVATGDDKRHATKGVSNRLAAWIREEGFTEKRKAPNHAFRHWFKSACLRAGVQDSVADAIQGHQGNRGEADRYRHADIKTMAKAIASIEVPHRPAGI
jgi:integrase